MTRMIALALILLAADMAVSAVASWISRRKPQRALGAGTASAVASRQAEDRAMFAAQVRAGVALVFAAVMFLALFRASIGLTGQVGLPLALTAGLSASGGLLLYSTLPAAKQQAANQHLGTGASDAKLPRNLWTLASRRDLGLPAVVLLVYIAFIIGAGLTSAPDELGRHRVLRLESADASAAASPYPGWYFGAPLLVVSVLLTGAAFLALRRITKSPSLPDPRMVALDRRWREISSRVLLRITTGTLLGYLGGTALVAGMAVANAGQSFESVQGWGIATAAAGAALALGGVVFVVLAARDALTIRAKVRQGAPEPACAA